MDGRGDGSMRENGGVEILDEDTGVVTFHEEGLRKVKKGDVFRCIDGKGGEGVGPWVVAEQEPDLREFTGKDGSPKTSWHIKTGSWEPCPF
jgi:hypothetical protein